MHPFIGFPIFRIHRTKGKLHTLGPRVDGSADDRPGCSPTLATNPRPFKVPRDQRRSQRGWGAWAPLTPPPWNDTLCRGLWRAAILSSGQLPLQTPHFEKSGYAPAVDRCYMPTLFHMVYRRCFIAEEYLFAGPPWRSMPVTEEVTLVKETINKQTNKRMNKWMIEWMKNVEPSAIPELQCQVMLMTRYIPTYL